MNVKIRTAEYAGTVYEDLPQLPEVAFAGRSNVGKSTLINSLLGRRGLVRTSKQPGKTRNVNYFRVDAVDAPDFYMVDLPGYGYAKVCHDLKDAWDRLAVRYFSENENLRLLLLLVDIRRDIRNEERLALSLVAPERALILATKADKVNNNERAKRLASLRKQAGVTPLAVSSQAKTGLEDIWERILSACV